MQPSGEKKERGWALFVWNYLQYAAIWKRWRQRHWEVRHTHIDAYYVYFYICVYVCMCVHMRVSECAESIIHAGAGGLAFEPREFLCIFVCYCKFGFCWAGHVKRNFFCHVWQWNMCNYICFERYFILRPLLHQRHVLVLMTQIIRWDMPREHTI